MGPCIGLVLMFIYLGSGTASGWNSTMHVIFFFLLFMSCYIMPGIFARPDHLSIFFSIFFCLSHYLLTASHVLDDDYDGDDDNDVH